MHIECIYDAESIHNVITYIKAMLQWAMVPFTTLLSTFFKYFASDPWRCINYCAHCKKIEVHHYYSCNLRLFTLYYKCYSIYKTFTTYIPCRYVDTPLSYSMIKNTATQLLSRNLLRNLLGMIHTCNTLWFEQYSISYFNLIYMHIFWIPNIFITYRLDCHIT